MKLKLGLLAAAAAFSVAGPAQAVSLIVNGGFENDFGTTLAPGGFYNIGVSGANFAVPVNFGWTVGNNIDIIRTDNYGATFVDSGLYRIDLNGFGPGSISQTFNTVAGQLYSLTFDYTANGSGSADVSGVSAFSFTGNGGLRQAFATTFVGVGGPQTLTFAATTPGSGGVVLDNISVSAVPEAATWAMLIAGFGMAGASLRRRRTAVA